MSSIVKLPKANFDLRLQHIGCCMADKAESVRIGLTIGIVCKEDVRLFKYYSILLDMLKCYTVDDTLDCDAQDLINCLTTTEVDIIFARFADYCSHCYPLETIDISLLANCVTCS